MKCPFCRKDIPEHSEFCPHCMSSFKNLNLEEYELPQSIASLYCPHCHRPVKKTDVFCPNCRQTLETEAAHEAKENNKPSTTDKVMSVIGIVGGVFYILTLILLILIFAAFFIGLSQIA